MRQTRISLLLVLATTEPVMIVFGLIMGVSVFATKCLAVDWYKRKLNRFCRFSCPFVGLFVSLTLVEQGENNTCQHFRDSWWSQLNPRSTPSVDDPRLPNVLVGFGPQPAQKPNSQPRSQPKGMKQKKYCSTTWLLACIFADYDCLYYYYYWYVLEALPWFLEFEF